MRVRDVLPGVSSGTEPARHIECRECGANLTTDAEECPNCAGGVAVYELR
jgi:hypothetical protein